MKQKEKMERSFIENSPQLLPKKLGESARFRKTPYNPFKGLKRGNKQSNRWTTFKNII